MAQGELGALLVTLRKREGLTQEQLAAKTNGKVSLSFVGHIESGRRLARDDTLKYLAAALGSRRDDYDAMKAARDNDRAKAEADPAENQPAAMGEVFSRLRPDQLKMLEAIAKEMLGEDQ